MLSLAADLDGKCGVDCNIGESIMMYSKFAISCMFYRSGISAWLLSYNGLSLSQS